MKKQEIQLLIAELFKKQKIDIHEKLNNQAYPTASVLFSDVCLNYGDFNVLINSGWIRIGTKNKLRYNPKDYNTQLFLSLCKNVRAITDVYDMAYDVGNLQAAFLFREIGAPITIDILKKALSNEQVTDYENKDHKEISIFDFDAFRARLMQMSVAVVDYSIGIDYGGYVKCEFTTLEYNQNGENKYTFTLSDDLENVVLNALP